MKNLTPRPERAIKGRPTDFHTARLVVPQREADGIVKAAMQTWTAPTKAEARRWLALSRKKFPDSFAPKEHWDKAAGLMWNDFFTWGHDHDFGFGATRTGAMATRHLEITSETISAGMLPATLKGQNLLDVGCWTGGDLLVFAGMGARVTAIEEHPRSAAAATFLCDLVGAKAKVLNTDLYRDQRQWRGAFDVVYCSGVVYHVTDPILLLRICFAYLKVGGRLVIETKACRGAGSKSSYSGSRERGWNWFAPNRQALGRWLTDVGFDFDDITVRRRANGRLLAAAVKRREAGMPDNTGFSRPGSWLLDRV